MNEIQQSVRGNVTNDPSQKRFDDGNVITSFRLAHNERWFDKATREWINGHTIFFNVNCRRSLGSNVAASLSKGDAVIVHGRLRYRTWTKDGRTGSALEIEADSVGHDLSWGTSEFTRVVRTERMRSPEDEQNEAMTRFAEQEAEFGQQRDRLVSSGLGLVDPETGEILDGEGPLDEDLIEMEVSGLRESELSATA